MLPCSAFWQTRRFRLPNPHRRPAGGAAHSGAATGRWRSVDSVCVGGARDQRAFHPFLTLGLLQIEWVIFVILRAIPVFDGDAIAWDW